MGLPNDYFDGAGSAWIWKLSYRSSSFDLCSKNGSFDQLAIYYPVVFGAVRQMLTTAQFCRQQMSLHA